MTDIDATPAYCTLCGARLPNEALYCARCGGEVAAIPADDAPTRAEEAESVLAILPLLQRGTGFLGLKQQTYNLLVTPRRLVFASVSTQMMKDAVRQARDEVKSSGGGLLKQVGAQLRWVDVVLQRYRGMSPDAIVAEFPGSFTLPNAELRRISTSSYEDDDTNRETFRMVIQANSAKYRFELRGCTEEEARSALERALPPGVLR